MSLINFLIFTLSLLFSTISFSQEYFYRMDYRSEDDIFNHGFAALGRNDDLFLHIEGETCFSGSRDSVYVSTTRNRNFAIEWGTESRPGRTFYVYRIRADVNMYDAYGSLMNAYAVSGQERFRNTAIQFQHQEEWVSDGSIPASQIIDVSIYRSNGRNGAPDFLIGYSNPNYITPPNSTFPSPSNLFWNFTDDSDSSSSACSEECVHPSPSDIINAGNNIKILTLNNHIINCRVRMLSAVLPGFLGGDLQ